jgi:hypothetical protein
MFRSLQAAGRFRSFGGIPGQSAPYGYVAWSEHGALYTAVNPAQTFQTVALPPARGAPPPTEGGRVLFADAGYAPVLADGAIRLGPEQMCVAGFGTFDDDAYALGLEEDVAIPVAIEPLSAPFEPCGHNQIRAKIEPPPDGHLRINMTQSRDGIAHRSTAEQRIHGRSLAELLRISVRQSGQDVATRIGHDRAVWSGLSWATGEVPCSRLPRSDALEIVCSSAETQSVELRAKAYAVRYAGGTPSGAQ